MVRSLLPAARHRPRRRGGDMKLTALSLLLSATTLTVMWLAGNKNPWAWRIGLFSQALWAWFAVETKAYGLLPMNAALVVVYVRNLIRWQRASGQHADERRVSG